MLRPILVVFLTLSLSVSIIMSVGPTLDHEHTSTCEEFGRYARFNPYSVLNDWWITFYYWGSVQPTLHVKFTVPKPKEILYLKNHFSGRILTPINWTAPIILMQERNNDTYVLVEQGDRGQYLCFSPVKDLDPTETVTTVEVRIKQVDNGRFIGFMVCQTKTLFVLSRFRDLPRKGSIQDAAAKLGFKGKGGKSYLYQGHEWMPIPESDDDFMEPFRQEFS